MFFCPKHKTEQLHLDNSGYACSFGCKYPVINNIPRFVEPDNYASSFGLQWNRFSKTQLDSYTGTNISSDRLKRITGGDLTIFQGKKVLEVGCGAGRFTEIMLNAGAFVNAVDLSSAVEANYRNCSHFKNYSVCQATVYQLPFTPEMFDMVVCIGVIQHTPNPEKTIESLCQYLKPGGRLLIDHYTYGYPETFFRKIIRKKLLKKNALFSFKYTEKLVKWLLPIHKLCWKLEKIPLFGYMARAFIHFSPLVDYHRIYPQLSREHLTEWMFLDTHDTLTDFYKHLRNDKEIKNCLEKNHMENIIVEFAGNGIESRSFKKEQSCVESVE
jgi:2-polyprenyl-3-methyl-5-hydroxy-6-metoxy-1,4-benzoquinol methylase